MPAMRTEPASCPLLAPLDPMAPLRDVEAIAEGVAATLRVAHGLVEARRRVDLAGLDRMVGLLCARALDLAPEQGRALRPRLMAIDDDLVRLGAALAVEVF
jgi:hypothetical protein